MVGGIKTVSNYVNVREQAWNVVLHCFHSHC